MCVPGFAIRTRTPVFRTSNARIAFVFAVATAIVALASCGRASTQVDVTAGAEQRDEHGVVFREHRIAGLRVVETIVGGEAPFGAPLPVLVHLHGRGDRVHLPGAGFAGLSTPVRLILPEAPEAYGEGFTWSPVSVTQNRPLVLAQALRTNADRIAEVIAWVVAARPVVGRPIVAGFSQGGMLSFTLAVRHPTQIGTAIPVAGFIPSQLLPRHLASHRELPLIDALHGTDDPVVRIGPTRRAVRRLRQLGFEVDFEELPGVRHLWNEPFAEAFRGRVAAAVARERGRLSISSDVGLP